MNLEPSFCTSVVTDPAAAYVFATGEIDAATAPILHNQLRVAVDDAPSYVVVDFAAVTFMDSSGLAELITAGNRLRDTDIRVVLRHVRPAVRRVFEVTGLDTVFPIEDCVSCEGLLA